MAYTHTAQLRPSCPNSLTRCRCPVQAFQLEIKVDRFQNNDSAVTSTAGKLADVLTSLPGFRRLPPEQEISLVTESPRPTEQYELIAINKIKIVGHHRKDLGDIESLAQALTASG